MTSFQRQLNLYGFQRIIGGKDRGGYYHEMFLRGRPDIARVIVRTPVKGQSNAQSIVGDDPDFHSYTVCEEGKSEAKIAQFDEPAPNSETDQNLSTETKKRPASAVQPTNPHPPIHETWNGSGGDVFGIFPQAMIANSVARLPATSVFPAFTQIQSTPNPLMTLQLLSTGNHQARQTFLSLRQTFNPGEDSAEQLRRLRRL